MDSFSDVWKEVLAVLQPQLTEVVYNMWIEPLEPVKLEGDTVVMLTNSDFKKKIILERFYDVIVKGFEAVLGFPVELDIIVSQPVPEKKAENTEAQKQGGFTFDNFIVGGSNKFAYSACYRVSNAPGSEYNPLLVYGKSGLGKTHLMLAIREKLHRNFPDMAIIYITGEDFANELYHCIAEKNTDAFHEKYRNVDVLLMDDIQFIQRKQAAQEEFFHTFNTLTQAGKQVVMTSDRPPKEMEILDDRLRTRFEMGLLADIQPPDIDTRMAIVKRKADECKLTLTPSVIEMMAEHVKSNVRQLEGCVKKLSAMKNLHDIDPTPDVVQGVLTEVVSTAKPVSEVVTMIIDAVVAEYRVTVADIKSEKRNANISLARQVAMYIIREMTGMPLQNIGEYFSGKNHATVSHSVKQVEIKMEKDSSFKLTVRELIKNLEEA